MVLPEDYNFRFVVIIRVVKYLSECDTLKSRENLCEDAMTFFFKEPVQRAFAGISKRNGYMLNPNLEFQASNE